MINSLDRFGGAESSLLALAQAQIRLGHSVDIVAVHGYQNRFTKQVPSPTIHFANLPPRFWLRPRRVSTLIRFFQSADFDVVHSHLPRAQVVGRIAGILSARKVLVITEQNVGTGRKFKGVVAHRLLNRFTDAVIAVSNAVAEDVVSLDPKMKSAIRVIANCVDESWFNAPSARIAVRSELKIDNQMPIAICIARFAPHKRQQDLVRAFVAVRHNLPGARLLLVGEGPEEPAVRDVVNDSGLGEHVRFLGPRSDVRRLLDGSDVAVLASLWEGLPMTLIEAQARGRAVVATNVPGTRDAVVPGETALLVPPKDETVLAEALTRLLSDPAYRNELGAAGRRRAAQQYGSMEVARETIALYRDVARRKSEQRPLNIRKKRKS